MIDSTSVRGHVSAVGGKGDCANVLGRSRGVLTSKMHLSSSHALSSGRLDTRGLEGKEFIAQVANLVLDLPLLPPRRRQAGHRVNQMVRTHLREALVILARLANEDRRHLRLHVVVDAR